MLFESLEAFSPEIYKMRDDEPPVDIEHGFNRKRQIIIISKLIMDMTMRGATDEELERAIRHSLVIIDAKRRHLDWRKSEKDHGIAELKKKYSLRPDKRQQLRAMMADSREGVQVSMFEMFDKQEDHKCLANSAQ